MLMEGFSYPPGKAGAKCDCPFFLRPSCTSGLGIFLLLTKDLSANSVQETDNGMDQAELGGDYCFSGLGSLWECSGLAETECNGLQAIGSSESPSTDLSWLHKCIPDHEHHSVKDEIWQREGRFMLGTSSFFCSFIFLPLLFRIAFLHIVTPALC